MADRFGPEVRSRIMSRIRSKNTSPEVMVFRNLRREKIYFQKHYKRVKGSPDIALPKKMKAVFIDGDFWHGRTLAKRKATLPEYWVLKIENNIKRDRKNRMRMRREGWKILRVWESDLRNFPNIKLKEVRDFLTND